MMRMDVSILLRLEVLYVLLALKTFPSTLGFIDDCVLANKTNLTNVDAVIYAGGRIHSNTTDIPSAVREDLLEAHWIYSKNDKTDYMCYIEAFVTDIDNTLKVYDSAAQVGVLAHPGSFNKYNENILLVIGPETFNKTIPWRSRKMVYLNTILEVLFLLFEPHSLKQRYKQMYVYNATEEVLVLAKSIESGRRIVRYISNVGNENLTAENVAKMMDKFFDPTIITQELLDYPQGSKSKSNSHL
ncbi:unnamed protein product [Rodentolepis nana]|uniref:Ig-like domain-containing protein n=1 Tax=Rodentolepis nana TaxID=102285 RepID=A0A0R3TBR0_RODNA|nr:unnamed protein product [Rodentolepis nana]